MLTVIVTKSSTFLARDLPRFWAALSPQAPRSREVPGPPPTSATRGRCSAALWRPLRALAGPRCPRPLTAAAPPGGRRRPQQRAVYFLQPLQVSLPARVGFAGHLLHGGHHGVEIALQGAARDGLSGRGARAWVPAQHPPTPAPTLPEPPCIGRSPLSLTLWLPAKPGPQSSRGRRPWINVLPSPGCKLGEGRALFTAVSAAPRTSSGI